VAKCDGPNCDAEIVWAETPAGAKQPFDREPDPKGNRVLLGRGPDRPPLAIPASIVEGTGALEAKVGAGEPLLDECRYVPHHATCPDRGRF
jgi:hypothetical protein